jgi:hypothetical protein
MLTTQSSLTSSCFVTSLGEAPFSISAAQTPALVLGFPSLLQQPHALSLTLTPPSLSLSQPAAAAPAAGYTAAHRSGA